MKIYLIFIFTSIFLTGLGLTAQVETRSHNIEERLEDQESTQLNNKKNEFLNSIETNQPDNSKDELCVPEYSTGCSMGDGFTDFAVEEIENYGSGCEDNMGYDGWSQYLELGPAFLIPGFTHDFILRTGYNNQLVTIWIDFDDDYVLTESEKVLIDFELEEAGTFYTAQVPIPPDAQMGLHIIRARTNWGSSASDPCDNYNYGEAEDYMVVVGEAAFGTLEGYISELAGGTPVEGAEIILEGAYSYSASTASDGTYQIEDILVGEYTVECFKEGYNVLYDMVLIEEDIISVIDFLLTQPGIQLNTFSVSKTLPPNTTGEESIYIENTGNGELNWAASMLMLNESAKDFMDLQFQYEAMGSSNEAGIETDGNYIYTTEWGGNGFFKYDMEGNFNEEFTIPDTYAIRDLAFDGTHFYGGAASYEVFEMDFESQTLISTFTAPTVVRGIAYNQDEDVFYANNWNTPVYKFDKTGATLGNFNVGPEGDDYYGFAYDNTTFGGPFLWGYAQVGSEQNTIIQIQLPSGTETGFTMDVTTILSGYSWGSAGGMFTHPNIVVGKMTLGGLVQGDWIWGVELSDAQTWLWVNPTAGTLEGGAGEEILVEFDATDLDYGVYEAEIHFTTVPDAGTPIVDVTLTVTDVLPDPPNNLSTSGECDTLELCWDVNVADSCSIYNNGSWHANTTETCYTFAGPGNYQVYLTAWFGGNESEPSNTIEFEISWPADIEPMNFAVDNVSNNIVSFSWDNPTGCALEDGFNIYRDGTKINEDLITELYYSDTLESSGTYEYYTTAVYYFGESDPSNVETVVITSIEDNNKTTTSVFPNPVKDQVYIQSVENIERIELLNKLGKIILSEQVKGNLYQINVSDFDPGIYFLKIKNDQKVALQKIVIE